MEAQRLAEPGLVWPQCWIAAQVFELCQWIVLPRFGATPLYQGIGTQEIEAACRVLGVPRADRAETVAWVRMMANAAAPVLNERKT
ncbi:MAG: hypothetical protein F9K31_02540 [Dokdonella sp.]|nr:MAG: hypothetical protein F9K31_02540 [Dokdonella sp.]